MRNWTPDKCYATVYKKLCRSVLIRSVLCRCMNTAGQQKQDKNVINRNNSRGVHCILYTGGKLRKCIRWHGTTSTISERCSRVNNWPTKCSNDNCSNTPNKNNLKYWLISHNIIFQISIIPRGIINPMLDTGLHYPMWDTFEV